MPLRAARTWFLWVLEGMATQVALEEAGRRASVCLSHVSALKLRLSVLHDTTQPLSECTKALTLAQANITCTLGRIERITSHFDAVNEIESSLSHSQEPGEIELEEIRHLIYIFGTELFSFLSLLNIGGCKRIEIFWFEL